MRLVQLSEDFKDDPVEQCYREALLQTLTSARRRRVHLGSHHRAIRNNGRGTRNRLDGQRPTQAELNEGNYTYPINALLENFKGLLLEITETEARGVCQDILHKPYLVDDFLLRNVMYPKKEKGHQASYSDSGVMNDARSDAEITAAVCNDTLVHYYLMPEVVNNVEEGICVGLLVVDPVRLLLVVEKEKEEGEQTAIPDITLEQIQQVLPNGRFFNPGLGYNRQT
ncbi:hypothetical protein ADEAN_000520800 [Angomonas deanei]|uniref:Uncharacterized protein n=1 Tax=Angomonas deanei TaxID=59799 RepID=A0A7G2CD23_9TRYP|nr:hypothetical protein ADEAN_000520800 [Angomonas deanei]